MARKSKKNALQEIDDGIDAHLSKLDPKERAQRHKSATDYVALLIDDFNEGFSRFEKR